MLFASSKILRRSKLLLEASAINVLVPGAIIYSSFPAPPLAIEGIHHIALSRNSSELPSMNSVSSPLSAKYAIPGVMEKFVSFPLVPVCTLKLPIFILIPIL